MKYPNAYKGVKKLFVVELLAVVAAILAVVASALSAIGLTNTALVATAGSLALSSTIVLIVVFILQLVGLHQAGKDEKLISYAFCVAVLSILVSVVGSILASFKSVAILVIIGNVCQALANASGIVIAWFTLKGIAALAGRLGDSAMKKRGETLAFYVIFFVLLSLVFEVLDAVLKGVELKWLMVTIAILAIIASIAELVVYVVTFLYYGKAVKMLKK